MTSSKTVTELRVSQWVKILSKSLISGFLHSAFLLLMLGSPGVSWAQNCLGYNAFPISHGKTEVLQLFGASTNSTYPCRAGNFIGPERVFTFTVVQPSKVSALLEFPDPNSTNADIFLISSCSPVICVASGDFQIAEQTLQAGTYFLIVDSKTTTPFTVRLTLTMKDLDGYCLPDFISTCSPAYFIDSVLITSPGVTPVARLLSGCNGNALNYSVTTSNQASVFRTGATVKLNVRMFRAGSHHSAAWIDFNNDKLFDPSTELLYDSNGRGKGEFSQTINHAFRIPELTSYGPKRLRIRNASEINGDVALVSPCNELFQGETEDYILNIEPAGCTPKYTVSCPSAARTHSFRLKGINNLNVTCNGNAFDYTNYPSSQFTTGISPGVNYTTTLSFSYNASAGIWIDYNNDGDFLDAGELVGSINTAALSGSPIIKVPTTASAGVRKMRVRTLDVSRTWALADACATLTGSGLTQDYTITIVAQAISLNNQSISACRGQLFNPGGTATGDFRDGNRFLGQFSDANGSFANAATITDVDLGTSVTSFKPLPSNLVPGAAYKFRIVSTNPALTTATTKNVVVQSNLCNSPGVTTGKISNTLTLNGCKGQVIAVPFSKNDISTIEWKVQISGPEGAEPFTDIPGAIGVTSPISVTIPATLASAKNYRIRISGNIGGSQPIITSVSPTLLTIETCLNLTTTPATLCKGVPTTLVVSSTGITNGTAYKAELSASNGGFLAANNTVIGTSTVNSSIVVTVPCNAATETHYRIRLVATAPGSEPGSSSGNVSVPASCPLNPPALPTLLCRGSQISSQLNAGICFNAGNDFLLDFYSPGDTSFVLFSIPITATGGFTVPANATPGTYFIRHRSTSPHKTSVPVGPFSLLDCPVISLNSVCRGSGQLTAQFSTTNPGSFFPGNEFRVELSSQAAGAQPVELGRTSVGSPVVVPQEPTGYPNERRLRIISTNPVISSNFINIDGAVNCITPTITVQSVSTNLQVAGAPAANPTALVCSGSKIRIDFTTTGIFGANQKVVPRLSIPNQITQPLGSFPVQSPLIITLPPGITPGTVVGLRLTSPFPVVTVSSANQATLTMGSCPTLATGILANTDFCANSNLSIPFTTSGVFQPGNVFSAEILATNGAEVSAPIALVGTGTGSPLQVSLPPGFSGSGSFLVRVKSSIPELVGANSATIVNRLVPVLEGYTSQATFPGGVSKISGKNLNTVTQALLGTTTASFVASVNGNQIDLTIPNTTSGNWTVRNQSCISNALAQTVSAAINFNLFNAETDQSLGVLKGGTTIDLTDLSSFNIRGNLNATGFDKPGLENPGSVKIELNGPVSQTIIDNNSPFTLFGETLRADGSLDVLGSTLPVGSYSIKATPYAFDDALGSSGIVWTTAFSVAPPRVITTGSLPEKVCQGEALDVDFSTAGLFKPETVYSVELSAANGSFTNPMVLGIGNASPITVQIPVNQPAGNGYRIRVSSANPTTPTLYANSNGDLKIKKSPVLTSLSKSDLRPGDQTTINGTGFSHVTEVLFNGMEASNFSVTGNEQKIKAKLPVGATSGLVTVVNGGCTSPTGLPYTEAGCNGRMAVSETVEPVFDGYSLFPNPTLGKLTLHRPEGEIAQVTILNTLGRNVLSLELTDDQKETEIDLSLLPAGLYQVQIESVSGKKEFRVVRK